MMRKQSPFRHSLLLRFKSSSTYLLLALLAVISQLLICPGASPQGLITTYTYTGNPFTRFSGTLPAGVSRITGSFTLSNPLGANFFNLVAPLSFSFTDGATTVTKFNSTGVQFFVSTDAAGTIVGW